MAITLGDAILYLKTEASGLSDGLAEASGSINSWVADAAKVMATGLAAGVAAVGAGIVGLGKLALDAGETLDGVFDGLAVRTGATGSDLAGLQEDFRQVFASVPGDAQLAGDAMGILNQRTGATGETLQGMTTNLLQASRLMGGDAKTNATLLSDLMFKYGLNNEDAAGALDQLFVASQQSGVGMDVLMQQTGQYSNVLQGMGWNLTQSTAFLASMGQAGVNTEQVMLGLRTAGAKFADQGIDLSQGLQDTTDKIMGAASETDALAIAYDTFGTRAGPEMVRAIRSGNFHFSEMQLLLANADGTIQETAQSTMDWGEKWQLVQQKGTLALEPLGGALMGIASQLLDVLMPLFDKWAPLLGELAAGVVDFISGASDGSDLFASLSDVFGEGFAQTFFDFVDWVKGTLIPTVQNIAGQVFPLLGQAVAFVQEHMAEFKGALMGIAALFAGSAIAGAIPVVVAALGTILSPVGLLIAAAALLGAAWNGNWFGIRDTLTAAWNDTIQPALVELMAWLQVNVPIAMQALADFWNTTLLPALQAIGTFITTQVVPVIQQLAGWLATNVPIAMQAVVDFWNGTLAPALQAIWQFISGTLIPTVSSLVDWLATNITAAMNTVATIWNTILQPAFQGIVDFLNVYIFPLLGALADVYIAAVGLAFRVLQGIWQNELYPALMVMWGYFQNNINPILTAATGLVRDTLGGAMTWLNTNAIQPLITVLGTLWGIIKNDVMARLSELNTILDVTIRQTFAWFKGVLDDLVLSFNNIKEIIRSVIEKVQALADAISNIDLGPLQPGSPTPMELGLLGIARAAGIAARALAPILDIGPAIGWGGFIDPRAGTGAQLLMGGPAGLRRYIEPMGGQGAGGHTAFMGPPVGTGHTGYMGPPISSDKVYNLTIQVANDAEARDVARSFEYLETQFA